MTIAEENYLKAIFHLSEESEGKTGTNAIAQYIQTSAASVTDMVQRLADKKLVSYEKYKGVALTAKGMTKAKEMIRNHRLWEVFLVLMMGIQILVGLLIRMVYIQGKLDHLLITALRALTHILPRLQEMWR